MNSGIADDRIDHARRGPGSTRTLTLVWYAAVIGAAFQLNFFFWEALSLAMPGPQPDAEEVGLRALQLAGWCALGWIAHRGRRHGVRPSQWTLVGVAVLVWVMVIAMRLTVLAD